jgi:hypothetical protein
MGQTLVETTRIDVASSTVTYVGKAKVGSSEGDPVWRIQKIISNAEGDMSILFVDGKSDSNSTWNDRAMYAYV